jgi:hypothetical protein
MNKNDKILIHSVIFRLAGDRTRNVGLEVQSDIHFTTSL